MRDKDILQRYYQTLKTQLALEKSLGITSLPSGPTQREVILAKD